MVPPLPERKTAKASPIPPLPETWSAAEISDAKARCTAALKGLDADVTAEAPIKEGLCGTAAPIRLARLGSVTFSPAALINCGLLRHSTRGSPRSCSRRPNASSAPKLPRSR